MGAGGQEGGQEPGDGKVEAVLTCQGDIHDPEFPERCQRMFDRLSQVLNNDHLDVTKCEPWNSVKVTFNLPKDAAEKLARLAESGDEVLRELGILSLQMEGGQVISVTMMNDDSDSEEDRTNLVLDPKPSTSKVSPSKARLSPNEDKPVTIKQEVDLTCQRASSADPSRPTGLYSGFAGGARDTVSAGHGSMQGLPTSVAAAAMLMKNLPSSAAAAASLLLPADQSVLTSYSSGQLGSKEQLLANLIARGKEHSVSPLLGHLLRDSDEPASKKPRKTEMSSSSVKSSKDTSNYYNKGFSLLPVSSTTADRLRLTGSQSSVSESLRTSPVGSALRLASLPGVSLTAVSSRNTPNTPVSSHRLMPPPSSAVTLSPVPRTNSVSVTPSGPSQSPPVQTNPAELRCIETGDKSPSVKPSPSVHSVDISPSTKQSLSRPLLINPVTGQFEAGSTESTSESDSMDTLSDRGPPANTQGNDLDSNQDDGDRHNKHKAGSQSPGNSTSEQPLIIKLKVSSIPNNSSKNLVTQKNDALKTSLASKQIDEPKVPKIKIRIGRDQSIVKLNNDIGENHDVNDLEENLSPDKSHSPIPNDLKTKVKIKSLGTKCPLEDPLETPLNNLNSAFSSSIANHTSDNDSVRKISKKGKSGKEKKDRLAVWTESLAKHGEKRDEKKEDRNKETKTWPEVLESRLYGSSGSTTVTNSIPTHSNNSVLSFNKSEVVLETHTEKEDGSGKPSLTTSSPGEPHLNWVGPGRSLECGPGPSPASPRAGQPSHQGGKERLSVLDILERRPPTGEPGSPGPQGGGQDTGGHQGEDSGIESMDSRSEKSPNQGESPFHATSESGADIGHLPTYSSSMGSSSGKLSPPVSDSGSTDSAVTGTPPDKSPIALSLVNPVQNSLHQPSTSSHNSLTADNKLSRRDSEDGCSSSAEVTNPPPDKVEEEALGRTEEEDSISRNHSSSKNWAQGRAVATPVPDPVTSPLHQAQVSCSGNSPVVQSSVSEHVPALNYSEHSHQDSDNSVHRPISEDEPKTDLPEPFINSREQLEDKSDEVLHRSCDGTHDLNTSPTKEPNSSNTPEISNCMHDYTFKNGNNLSNKNGEREEGKTTAVKATLLTKRLIDTSPGAEAGSILPTLMKVSLPENTMSSPVSTVSLGGGHIQIRSAMQVPPGAKMVPVKLITVPGAAGNIRMLRVSPVKSGVFSQDIKVTSMGSTSLPPRTIVLKSSILKAVTTQGLLAGGSLGTATTVRYPTPHPCDTAVPPSEPSQPVSQPSIVSQALTGVSLLQKSHSVNLTPVEGNVGLPQPGHPTSNLDSPLLTTKAAPVMFEKRSSVEERRSREETETASLPLSVDVSHRLSDTNQMPSPACKVSSTQPSLKFNGGDDSSEATARSDSVMVTNSGDDSTNGSSDVTLEPGESLLRPLLAIPDLDDSLLPGVTPRKRCRRNTGSSVASDRSDVSVGSHSASKRNKGCAPMLETEEKEGRQESQESLQVDMECFPNRDTVSPHDENGEDGDEVDDGEDDDLEEEEEESNSESETDDRSTENNGGGRNGLTDKSFSSKKLSRNSGDKLKGRLHNSNKNLKLGKKTSPKLKGVTKKVGRQIRIEDQTSDRGLGFSNPGKTDLAARRVSTRSKKPDEAVGPNSKKR